MFDWKVIFSASLRLSEAEHRNSTFPAFQCGGLGRDPTTFITMVFVPFLACFLGAVQTCPSPTHPPHLYLFFAFFTRENNCMDPISCVCKLLSVGFQHCLTFAYSKTVNRHCLQRHPKKIAIMLSSFYWSAENYGINLLRFQNYLPKVSQNAVSFMCTSLLYIIQGFQIMFW